MKFKLLFLVFIAITCLSLNAQNININPFWEGEIKLNDGTVKKGLVQVPNSLGIRAVSFRKTKNAKKERIRKKHIESILVVSTNGREYLFEPLPVVLTIKGNSSWGKSMLLVTHQNDYVKFYISQGYYRVNKKGQLYMLFKSSPMYNYPTTFYYIKKRGFKKARLLHMSSLARGLKKSANNYLNEDPELLKKINDGELKFHDMYEIIETYMKTTQNL